MNRLDSHDKHSRQLRYFVAELGWVLLLTMAAMGQSTTGTLRGQVLDPQGAAIANAKIRITNQETAVVSNTTSSSAGTWNLPSLIPGKYSVSVEASGFRQVVRKDVLVLADRDNTASRDCHAVSARLSVIDSQYVSEDHKISFAHAPDSRAIVWNRAACLP